MLVVELKSRTPAHGIGRYYPNPEIGFSCLGLWKGDIFVNNVPISKLSLQQYRQLFSTVMQHDTLSSGSIAENISMFPSIIDFNKVEACAELACVGEDIERMKKTVLSIAHSQLAMDIADRIFCLEPYDE